MVFIGFHKTGGDAENLPYRSVFLERYYSPLSSEDSTDQLKLFVGLFFIYRRQWRKM